MITKKELQSIHQKLHAWYQEHGRKNLPWRETKDPYHIYLSEIMLQQTQVNTVKERYYFQFLKCFPTLQSLADAPLDDVLKIWEGLGYYRRAKNLHAAAKLTAPTLPKTYDELLELPGIGENTASAISAFAYHQPLAILEANVKRVLSRIYAYKEPTQKILQQDANTLLDRKNPYDYNQAMMDIGSILCTIKEPHCQPCPFLNICKAYEEGYFLYPVKKKKIVPIRKETWLVKVSDKQIYLQQRKGEFLHGLWGFEKIGIIEDSYKRLGKVTQSYTHFKLEATIFYTQQHLETNQLFSYQDIEKLPLSNVDKKVITLLQQHL